MGKKPNQEATGRRGGIDPAALAAASLAAAISAISPPGPYSPYSIVIGLTILILIFAYDVDPERTFGQSIAFSAVSSLISLLIFGYPLEYYFAKDQEVRLKAFWRELPQDISYSEVPHLAFIGLWILLAVCFTCIDRRRTRKSETKN